MEKWSLFSWKVGCVLVRLLRIFSLRKDDLNEGCRLGEKIKPLKIRQMSRIST